MRAPLRFALAALALLAAGHRAYSDAADKVLDRIVENWRWSHYWFGNSGIDDAYVEGKKISALIFWNQSGIQPIRGLCSSEISVCVGYFGVYLDAAGRRMPIGPNVPSRQAFTSFVNSGFHDPSHLVAVDGFTMHDFQTEQKSITLPAWEPPDPVKRRVIPEEASHEAEEVKRVFRCWSEARPRACAGGLVFAYRGDADPYWFVLRSCSAACEFKGESVEMLRRRDRGGWDVTIGGFIRSPDDRLKQQIEKAGMFRLQL